MTPAEFRNAPSEIHRYRSLVAKYCEGPGLDIASQGDPVVPWAWSLELPEKEFAHYNSNHAPHGPIQLRGHGEDLSMIGTGSLSFVSVSHLLEDFAQSRWQDLMREWSRVLKRGGYLIILVPEVHLWAAYVRISGKPNCSHHSPEPSVGDMSRHASAIGLEVIHEGLTALVPEDYTILGVFRVP